MAEVAFDDFPRVGPGRVRMRKIVRPHDVVLSPIFQIFTADVIVKETGIDLIFYKTAGITGDRRRVLLFETIVIVVPLLKHPGHPAALVFHRDDFELGIPFKHAVMDDLEERVGDIH